MCRSNETTTRFQSFLELLFAMHRLRHLEKWWSPGCSGWCPTQTTKVSFQLLTFAYAHVQVEPHFRMLDATHVWAAIWTNFTTDFHKYHISNAVAQSDSQCQRQLHRAVPHEINSASNMSKRGTLCILYKPEIGMLDSYSNIVLAQRLHIDIGET